MDNCPECMDDGLGDPATPMFALAEDRTTRNRLLVHGAHIDSDHASYCFYRRFEANAKASLGQNLSDGFLERPPVRWRAVFNEGHSNYLKGSHQKLPRVTIAVAKATQCVPW